MSSDCRENKKKQIGWKHAFRGMVHAVRSEINLRIEILVAICVIVLGFLLRVSLLEWAILMLTIGFVLTIELINTTIERIMDFYSPQRHSIVGLIKDIAAGAVLCSAFFSIIIGCIIFLPKIIDLL
ncbi:diacylglycerol kinase family protein [Aquibacillus salsiterrae]|uniref:Diacylglycerol kinase family protein n=1 Tax=Aquibacillus salsiterrae TaxID=2950439 RepID=A0A9X4ADQ7_9BACI|nr:diacylglycerol kinase family protein [Aquibacillus salsiterrae]MDC3415554.1 diacylglycerol kinase family protein [Aquibacillus salsiterrae]